MNNEIATLMALTVSLLCLLYLRNTDPKRRRVYRLPVLEKARWPSLGWLMCLLPGAVLLYAENYAALIMWFAALSVVGWCIALPKPKA